MRTRQKRRILPDTMIQEIGRSVKCQKLNKFISRTPKLSVNKPNPLRGDQFPGIPRWLSGHAGTFYPLTVLPRRNLIPRQTHLLPGIAKELLPAGALRSNVVGTCGSPTNAPSQNAVQGFAIGSACAAAFFHRGIIPLLTLFFSASGSQKTAVTPLRGRAADAIRPAAPPAGGSVPWRPLAVMRECRALFPPHSPACRA